MQYKKGNLEDQIRPYRRPRLTDSNCAIDIDKQAKLYREAIRRQGIKAVHVFPGGGNAARAREGLLITGTLPRGTVIKTSDPKDWK